MFSTLGRTFNPKFTTYGGDGNGRDGYIIFNNGGLNELRDYQGSVGDCKFKTGPNMQQIATQPRKEATAFDYIPDGSGRDTYIIRSFGLKRDYRSNYNDFQKQLRSGSSTPMMDAEQIRRRSPHKVDGSFYTNWPSPKAVLENIKTLKEQRKSVERLFNGSARTSPMSHYIKGTATINTNPQDKVKTYL